MENWISLSAGAPPFLVLDLLLLALLLFRLLVRQLVVDQVVQGDHRSNNKTRDMSKKSWKNRCQDRVIFVNVA
jgi:hypothetical protein